MEFKDKIYDLRKDKNMSQDGLALELGVSRQAVAKWENGESYPDINNLVGLSNLFSISLDRLLKDDNCMESVITKSVDSSNLIEFLIKAKKNTYAGSDKKEEISCRSCSNDLVYQEGDYKYFDSYFGGERFVGEEVLFVKDKPVWAMNYSGVEFNEKFSGKEEIYLDDEKVFECLFHGGIIK